MTWGDVLSAHGEGQPGRTVFSFYADGADTPTTMSYGELDRRARALAATLTVRGLRGRPVLLVLHAGLDYVASFFGCLYAGVIAVPAYPPSSHPRSLERLVGMVHDCGADTVVTSAAIATRVAPRLAAVMDAPPTLITTESIEDDAADAWRRPDVRTEDVAFLQYTSGSTARPRGVVLSHANLLANTALIGRTFGLSQDTRAVSWLPMYHDMGLIGSVLGTVRCGGTCALMTPASFVRNPVRWLELISGTHATASGGPNFAYDLCARQITDEQLGTLDLSSWEVAFNGAEPVRADTLTRFAERLAPAGFRASAILPCYGLAESSLLVTAGPKGTGFRTRAAPREAGGGGAATDVVSSGRIPSDVRVEIVDPGTGVPVRDGGVGEVWVAGPSVARGYWNRADTSGEVFGARLSGLEDVAFLRTGDLGFVADGDLHVTGRRKDLVIIRGRNHYPQDIEATVEACDPVLVPGGGAAFAVTGEGGERLVVVHEVRRGQPIDGVAARVAARVAQVHGVRPEAVVLIRAASLNRTSSGKVARFACRAAYLDGALLEVARFVDAQADLDADVDLDGHVDLDGPAAVDRPDGPQSVLAELRAAVAAVLATSADQVPIDRPLTELGLDSLDAVRLRHRLETAYRCELADDDMFSATVGDLAAVVAAGSGGTSGAGYGDAPGDRGGTADDPTRSRPVDVAPSANQAGMWFLHQLAPDSTAYHLRLVADADGPVDSAVLRRAFDRVVARHPALRTTFPDTGSGPVQRIHPVLPPELTEADARTWTEAEVDAAVADAARPFDLADGPLLRVLLLRLAPATTRLVLVAHHLVCDLWSVEVLLDELDRFYDAELHGHPAPDLPAPIAFADAATRQSAILDGPDGARLRAYWQAALAGAPTTLELLPDHPRPPVSRFRGGARPFTVPAGVASRLAELARRHDTTLYTVLACAFQLFLSRYTGQRDLLLGSPVHGRLRADEAFAVGPFANTAVLRAVIDPAESFHDFLARAKTEVRAGLAHSSLPFAALVALSRTAREPNRAPLVQALFTLQRSARERSGALAGFVVGSPGARLPLGPLRLRPVPGAPLGAQFDLQLTFAECDGELAGVLQFDTDLFDPATADRMVGHLTTLLDGIGSDTATPVARLALMTPAELDAAVLRGEQVAPGPSVTDLIAAQAARTPDAPAVVFDDRLESDTVGVDTAYPTLTYRALDDAVNRLAHHLIRRGVAPGRTVGIQLHRSTEMLIAMLAVMRTGAAYLPIDPDLPAARVAYLLEDSAVGIVITTAAMAGALPPTTATPLNLDEIAEQVAAESADRPHVTPHPDDLCYVLYTSGSTGRPKGVGVRHRALANFLVGMKSLVGLASGDRLLAVTTISFDISGLELYLPLVCGATVHLLARHAAADGLQLRRRLDSGLVDVMQATPATWQLLCDAGWTPTPELTVVSGGEALPPALAERLRAGGGAVWNLYGPTETTIWSTAYRLDHTPQPNVPIGRPITNTEVYVVDPALQLVPVGVLGELLIGGDGLARGYLNRPGRTAASFVPDPFGGRPGARLYRTGDLARRTADGMIELFGRRDHQVKINGHRIELGEVEAALVQQPSVHRAVAAVHAQADGGAILVAYVVPATEGDEAAFDRQRAAAAIRTALREQLPGYLVPAQLVWMDDFPLAPTGKVDRAALRPPAATPARTYVPPTSPTAIALTGILDELLGVERISVTDNLFDLGAHSLLISRFVGKVRESCGVELLLSEIFAAPTVAELAEIVAAREGVVDESDRVRTVDRAAYRTTVASSAPRTVAALRRLHRRSAE